MKNSGWAGIIAAIALACLTSAPATASDHPRVKPSSCSALAKSGGSWFARFYGERVDINGGIQWDRETPCFKTQASCVNWLYWAQSDFPQNITLQRCRRGLP